MAKTRETLYRLTLNTTVALGIIAFVPGGMFLRVVLTWLPEQLLIACVVLGPMSLLPLSLWEKRTRTRGSLAMIFNAFVVAQSGIAYSERMWGFDWRDALNVLLGVSLPLLLLGILLFGLGARDVRKSRSFFTALAMIGCVSWVLYQVAPRLPPEAWSVVVNDGFPL